MTKANDKPTENGVIRFTEEENAIDYLEKACYFTSSLKDSPNDWKWVMLALHGALYGFAICVLQGEVVYPRGEEFFEKRIPNITKPNSEEEIISIRRAIKRCQDPEIMKRKRSMISRSILQVDDSQKESIKKLVKYRNRFIHYKPTQLIISTEKFPKMASDVLEVIRFLALEANLHAGVWENSNEIEELVAECMKNLENLQQ